MKKTNKSYGLVYVTTSNNDEAEKLSRKILNEKLAACANILNSSKSIYWWKGEINEDFENIIIFKTNSINHNTLINRIIDLHSYENPCVLFIPVTSGNPNFLEWIDNNTN